MSIQVTIHGRLTADPALRFTPSGQAVASFGVAENDRYLDKQTNEWKDGDVSFWNCQAWRGLAENICENFTKGQLVLVTGKMKQRSYEDKEGNKRTVYDVNVDAAGPSLLSKSGGAQPSQQGYTASTDPSLDPPF